MVTKVSLTRRGPGPWREPGQLTLGGATRMRKRLFSRQIRVDKRYSAALDYRWHRRCGMTRRECLELILARYGWVRR
jgi:hypothetical protein